MKFSLYSSLPLFLCLLLLSREEPAPRQSPLAQFSSQWNDAKYIACNTAATVAYLSDKEKELIYILNLVRTDPALFASTVLSKYPDYINQPGLRNIDEYKSLANDLKKLKSLSLLSPDSLCFISARCHAISSGETGYVGHNRKTPECAANENFNAECCDYGHADPLAIIMSLLIDRDIPSLGHRYACLGLYTKIGVSIQPHKSYSFNTVLDFYY
jgi:hypothetical protein